MFTFTDRYIFTWPVKVRYPAAGGEEIREFTGEFVLPEDELEIFEGSEAGDMAGLVTFARARLCKYWIGWSGIAVDGGGELAFSNEARDRLLRQRPIRMAVDAALTEAVLGIREKN